MDNSKIDSLIKKDRDNYFSLSIKEIEETINYLRGLISSEYDDEERKEIILLELIKKIKTITQ